MIIKVDRHPRDEWSDFTSTQDRVRVSKAKTLSVSMNYRTDARGFSDFVSDGNDSLVSQVESLRCFRGLDPRKEEHRSYTMNYSQGSEGWSDFTSARDREAPSKTKLGKMNYSQGSEGWSDFTSAPFIDSKSKTKTASPSLDSHDESKGEHLGNERSKFSSKKDEGCIPQSFYSQPNAVLKKAALPKENSGFASIQLNVKQLFSWLSRTIEYNEFFMTGSSVRIQSRWIPRLIENKCVLNRENSSAEESRKSNPAASQTLVVYHV